MLNGPRSIPKLVGVDAVAGRCIIVALLLIPPFFRFLLVNEYDLTRPEAAGSLLALGAASLALAVICRNTLGFYVLTLACIVSFSAGTTMDLVSEMWPVRFRWLTGLLALAVSAAMLLLRRSFFALLAVFVLSEMAVDVGQAVRGSPPEQPSVSATTGPLPHVLYLVLDAHIGPNGLPKGLGQKARRKIEETFLTHGFALYSSAFSNYAVTDRSIPSILNRRLLPERARPGNVRKLTEARLLSDLAGRGYAVNVYQSDFMELAAGNLNHVVTYAANSVGPIGELPISTRDKFLHLVHSYIDRDEWLAGPLAGRLAPQVFRPERAGPLAVAKVWPGRITRDILAARQKTLFFAHLITPHSPYLYHEDGTTREHSEWGLTPLTTYDPAVYRSTYARYAEQVVFVQGQLERLFGTLRRAGLLDKMTIVVHGDHGSRIRLLRELDRGRRQAKIRGVAYDFERYDYASEPPAQDLLDRFSTLLAVRTPAGDAGRIDPQPVSVMRMVHETLYPGQMGQIPAGADLSYLFDQEGQRHEFPMAAIFEKVSGL